MYVVCVCDHQSPLSGQPGLREGTRESEPCHSRRKKKHQQWPGDGRICYITVEHHTLPDFILFDLLVVEFCKI